MDGTTFEISVSGISVAECTLTASIAAGGVEDLAGNTNTVSTSTDNSVKYDTVKPDVTVNQKSGQADPTNALPIVFTAVFSEPIKAATLTVNQKSGQADPTNALPIVFTAVFSEPIKAATFTAADVTLAAACTGASASISEVAPMDGTTFEISVSGISVAECTLTASIAAGGVEDLAGNTNTVSTSTDNSVKFDTVQPDVTVNQKSGQADPTNALPIVFTAVFSEPIKAATFTAADVTLAAACTGASASISEVAPMDGTTFEISVSGISVAECTLTASIAAGGVEDLAGNTNTVSTSTDNSVKYDTVTALLYVEKQTVAIGNTLNMTAQIHHRPGRVVLQDREDDQLLPRLKPTHGHRCGGAWLSGRHGRDKRVGDRYDQQQHHQLGARDLRDHCGLRRH